MGGAPTTAVLGELWNEWEVHVAVVASFSLQVFLYLFAGIRRYSRSSVLHILLWLGFLLADVVATFAMGQISTLSKYRWSSPQQQLMAFWAPFLLLHLGGQDTITAFSLEDNRLWARHLLNMSVQVAAVAYLLYKYVTAGGHLSHAASLVFAAGVLRYGERVWALKRANMKGNESKWEFLGCHGLFSLHSILGNVRGFTTGGRGDFALYQRLVLGTHCMLYWFKPAILGNLPMNDGGPSAGDLYQCVEEASSESEENNSEDLRKVDGVYRAIQMELEPMYELVYTKAAVIRTWYGLCIRVFCLCSTLAALLIFFRASKRGYSRPDIVVTYILLIGAPALEVTSTLKEIGSTWTFWLFYPAICPRLKHIARAVLFVRYLIVRDGRWSNSIGQYNLISFCNRDRTTRMKEVKDILLSWYGVQASYHSSHVKLSTAVKQMVLRKIQAGHSESDQPEAGLPIKFRDHHESRLLGWSFECPFEESILLWHIATEVFLHFSSPRDAKEVEEAQVIANLSGYMMYLLAVHPHILPGTRAAKTHNEAITSLELIIRRGSAKDPYSTIRWNTSTSKDYMAMIEDLTWVPDTLLNKAFVLSRILVDNVKLNLGKRLGMVASVWLEMLCYTAFKTDGNFHARQLSKGGEFLTHVKLLMLHLGKKYSDDPDMSKIRLTQEEANIIRQFRTGQV